MDKRPIGIFDSGFGGLTVLSAIKEQLPNEHLIYFGDNGRTPYGTKSDETILKYTKQDMKFLLANDVKMIVIACNTASAVAYPSLRDVFDVPIVEVVRPGAKKAAEVTKNSRIGIIGTNATITSGVYKKAILQFESNLMIKQKPCPMFVPLVESGWTDNEIATMIAKEYLNEFHTEEIDTLVLGCTHYPLLYDTISRVMGKSVYLVNSAHEIALTVKDKIKELRLENISDIGSTEYYTSDSEERFMKLGSLFMNEKIKGAKKIDIEKYAE